jgi:hypothetical protein
MGIAFIHLPDVNWLSISQVNCNKNWLFLTFSLGIHTIQAQYPHGLPAAMLLQ